MVIELGGNIMEVLWIVSGFAMVVMVITLLVIAYAFYNFHKQSKRIEKYGKFW
jgi:cbb3-type cytochrome oxidase subunit 3